MKQLMILVVSMLLVTFNAKAGSETVLQFDNAMENPKAMAQMIMMQYDFNTDGRILEKEYVVMDGDSAYRAHLANMHRSLDIAHKDKINLHQYWFIELTNPRKYQKDLANYFQILDQDKDGVISIQEYVRTFDGNYISTFGPKFARLIDINQDNIITFKEYIECDFTEIAEGSYATFRYFDTNEDDVITLSEILDYYKNVMQR